MAEKKIGPVNVGITGNSGGLEKTVDRSKKKLGELADATKKANAEMSKGGGAAGGDDAPALPKKVVGDAAAKELADFDKQLAATISNIYNLRRETKKGGDTKGIVGSLNKQFDKIINDSSVVTDKQRKTLWQQVWGFSPGKAGGELLKKFTGLELVPESMAENAVVSGSMMAFGAAKAVGTYGVMNRNAYERDSTEGRVTGDWRGLGGVGDELTNFVEALPVVGNAIKGLKEDMIDAFSSVRQETDIMTKSMNAWIALEEKRKAIKAEIRQIERETASTIFHGEQQIEAIGDSAGRAGRTHSINRERDGTIFDADQKAQAGKEQLNNERSELTKEWQEKTREARNIVSTDDANSRREKIGGRDVVVTEEDEKQAALVAKARDELKSLDAQHNAALKLIGEKTAKIDADHAAAVKLADQKADKLRAINEGTAPDLDGINALFEQVNSSILAQGVDEFDRLAKAMQQLHPPTEKMKDFVELVGKLKDEQDKTEGRSLWKKMAEDLKDFGKTADEVLKRKLMEGGKSAAEADDAIRRQRASGVIANAKQSTDGTGDGLAYQTDKERVLSELGLAGADAATIARVKIALDTKEAGEKWKAFKDSIESLNVKLKMETAGVDERARRHAEIDAQIESDLKSRGITDPKQVAEARRQAESLKQKEDELRDAQDANTMKDDSDTKEKYQRRIDRIGELLNSGKIDEKTARDQINKVTKDYDAANMPRSNPDLMDYNGGGFQRLLLSQMSGVNDTANPELAEAKKTNEILMQIKNGQRPQIANF